MKTKHSVIRRAGGGLGTGALLMAGATIHLEAQVNYTTLSVPGAQDTYAQGISGGDVVGYYTDGGGVDHGFIYNGSTYTTFSASGAAETYAYGISGNDVVGWQRSTTGFEQGFLYNINSGYYTALAAGGGAGPLFAYGISGNNIAGYTLYGAYSEEGVLCTTYGNYFAYENDTILNVPGAQDTIAYGIDGNNIVGQATTGSFLYSGGAYTMLPLVQGESPEANGISGNKIVGYYYSGSDFSQVAHGFVYDTYSGAYDAFNIPGALNTYAEGVDGSDIVGYYQGAGGIDYGFIATSVPEPSDFGLLAAGAAAILAGRVRKFPLN
jgi:hypothetical protein